MTATVRNVRKVRFSLVWGRERPGGLGLCTEVSQEENKGQFLGDTSSLDLCWGWGGGVRRKQGKA